MRKTLSVQRLAISLALTFGLLSGGWVTLRAAAAPPPPAPGSLAAAISATTPGQLVVGVAPDFAEDDLGALLASSGATLEEWLPDLGLALAFTPIGEELAVAESLDADPAVDFIAPHRKLARVADVPLDPYWGQQWGMAQVARPGSLESGLVRFERRCRHRRLGYPADALGPARSHLVQPGRERRRSDHRRAHLRRADCPQRP